MLHFSSLPTHLGHLSVSALNVIAKVPPGNQTTVTLDAMIGKIDNQRRSNKRTKNAFCFAADVASEFHVPKPISVDRRSTADEGITGESPGQAKGFPESQIFAAKPNCVANLTHSAAEMIRLQTGSRPTEVVLQNRRGTDTLADCAINGIANRGTNGTRRWFADLPVALVPR